VTRATHLFDVFYFVVGIPCFGQQVFEKVRVGTEQTPFL